MNLTLCDYINDAIRVLVLLNGGRKRKTLMLNEYKIMQFDYFLKFPYTMVGIVAEKYGFENSIDEAYSFFHWQPDIIRYRNTINYLFAKGFISKDENSNYHITDLGVQAISRIENEYLHSIDKLCTDCVIPKIHNWTSKKIENEISNKANIIALRDLNDEKDN